MLVYCPFGGLVCTDCNRKVGWEKDLVTKVRDHPRKCRGDFSIALDLKSRQRAVGGALGDLKILAKTVAFLSPDQFREHLTERCTAEASGFLCTDCGVIRGTEREIKRAHQLGRKSRCRRNFRPVRCLRSRLIPSLMIPRLFTLEKNMAPWFKKYILVAREQGVGHPASMIVPPPSAPNAEQFFPHRLFSRRSVSPCVFQSFRNGIMSLPDHDEAHHQLFFRELQQLTLPCSSQPELMQYAIDIYGSVALRHFGGSFVSMSHCFTMMTSEPEKSWERNLIDAASRFMHRAFNQLQSVNPSLLIDAQKVGKYDHNASSRRINSAIIEFLDGIERVVDEGGEVTHMPTEEDKDLLFDRVTTLAETFDTNGMMPRKLGQLCKKTRSRYTSHFCGMLLFLTRTASQFLDVDSAKQLSKCSEAFHASSYETPVGREQAIGAVASLLMIALEVDTPVTYDRLVLKAHSAPAVYAMARAINLSYGKSKTFCFRLESPEKLHAITSALLHTLRVGYVACMIHATLSKDVVLQRLLPDASRLIRSSPVMELAHMGRLCKTYERFTSRGSEKAKHKIINGEDAFVIKHAGQPSTNVVIGQRLIKSALNKSGAELEKRLRRVLVAGLSGREIDVFDSEGGKLATITLVDDYMESVLQGIFGNLANYYDCGACKLCTETVKQSVRVGEQTPKDVELYASTMAARFFLRLPNGEVACFDSLQLAILLSDALVEDPSFRTLFETEDYEIKNLFGCQFLYTMRGSGRPWEVVRMQPGITNDTQTTPFRSSLLAGIGRDGQMMSKLYCSFVRRKVGGDGVDTGYMALPESIGQMLIVFLSVHCSAGTIYLGKELGLGHARKYLLLFFQVLNLTEGIKPTFGCWPSTEETFGRTLEQLLGVDCGSLTLGSIRQVACAISKRQDNLMAEQPKELRKRLCQQMTRSRAIGFNHSVTTAFRNYNCNLQMGNQLIDPDQQSLNDRMDEFHHQYIGASLLTPLHMLQESIDSYTEVWRRPRLMNDSQCLGFQRAFADVHYVKKAPTQRMILTEPISMMRDALIVAPCGSGKTCAVAAPSMYARLSYVARLGDEKRNAYFQHHSVDPSILQDEAVIDFFDFCSNDDSPPPAHGFTICVVPHVAAKVDLIRNLNKMQFVRATGWSGADRMDALVDKCTHASNLRSENVSDYDVLVLTVAMACNDDVRQFLERCYQAKILYAIVSDESHLFVTDLEYMTCLSTFVSVLSRLSIIYQHVPVIYLTGSLPACLSQSLATVTEASFGCAPPQWLNSCTLDKSNCFDQEDPQSAIREYVAKVGIWRPSNTLPTNVAHAVCKVPGCNDLRYAEYVLARLRPLVDIANPDEHTFLPDKVLIICKTRNLAKCVDSVFGADSTLLLGNDRSVGNDQLSDFQQKWMRGPVKIGVGTTVLAQSINQQRCNLVVCLDLLYNAVLYMQASSRGGRDGQQSLSLFLYRESHYQYCLDRQPCNHNELKMCGVDINHPETKHTLGTESLSGMIAAESIATEGTQGCRRRQLKREMDEVRDESAEQVLQLEAHVDPNWCCDLCSIPVLRVLTEMDLQVCNSLLDKDPSLVACDDPMEVDDYPDPNFGDHSDSPVDVPCITGIETSSNDQPQACADLLPHDPIFDEALTQLPDGPVAAKEYVSSQDNMAISVSCVGARHSPEQENVNVSSHNDMFLCSPCLATRSPSHDRENTDPIQDACSEKQVDNLILDIAAPTCDRSRTNNGCFSQLQIPQGGRKSRSPSVSKQKWIERRRLSAQANPYLQDCQRRDRSRSRDRAQTSTTVARPPLFPTTGEAPKNRSSVEPMISREASPRSICPVRAFVTMSSRDILYQCPWHQGPTARHSPILTVNPFRQKDCRSSFCSSLGRIHTQSFCFKCGDHPSVCQSKKFDASTCCNGSLKSGSGYCCFCGVFDSTGEPHPKDACPGNRLWGLVIWAFRSTVGHELMATEWTQSGAKAKCSGISYPMIAKLGCLNGDWQKALRFLVENRHLNYHFWKCVLALLKRREWKI